jgi:hypothetical protein
MADLSPAPQAVLAAALQELEQSDCTGIHRVIAAALRELAELDGIRHRADFIGPMTRAQSRSYRFIKSIADELENHVSEKVSNDGKWLPMESAPTDGTKILAICKHDDLCYCEGDPGLTPYGLWCESEGHVEDGPCVIA